MVDEQLAGYPTSLEHDLKMLEDENELSFNKANCIKYRIVEKQILTFWKECANQANLVLKGMSTKEARKEVNKWSSIEMQGAKEYFFGTYAPLLDHLE